jgi:hypothetical protein
VTIGCTYNTRAYLGEDRKLAIGTITATGAAMAGLCTVIDSVGHKVYMRVYQKVSGLATWSENCKWYSPLPLGAVGLLFCESV